MSCTNKYVNYSPNFVFFLKSPIFCYVYIHHKTPIIALLKTLDLGALFPYTKLVIMNQHNRTMLIGNLYPTTGGPNREQDSYACLNYSTTFTQGLPLISKDTVVGS